MNIAFYLVLKSKQMPAHNHPVIKRLYTGFTVNILCFICSYCMNIAFYLVYNVQADVGTLPSRDQETSTPI